jgi:nitrogen regulatory protein PII
MPPVDAQLVTIITVFDAEQFVQEALAALGVHGYSMAHVEGAGLHGKKQTGLVEAKNVAFSIVASKSLSVRILDWVDEHLLERYPGIAYLGDVVVVAARPID